MRSRWAWLALGAALCVAACNSTSVPADDAPDAATDDVAPDPDAALPVDDVPAASDTGVTPRDASARDTGTTPPDSGTGCRADWECGDFDACTQDRCVAGACVNSPIASCVGCQSDAECDDHDPSTEDTCNTFDRWCQHLPTGRCTTNAQCDDGDPCTIDECHSGGCSWGSNGLCCHRDTDCATSDPCVAGACVANACQRSTIPGCVPGCPDIDHDGHRMSICGGDDCNDNDPAVHPGAAEVCGNAVDDNCNGQADALDSACAPANGTCAHATALVPETPANGAVVWNSSTGSSTGCGAPAFYTFTTTATSDVTLELHLEDPPAAMTCPGCPPPMGPTHMFNYAVYLERTCGDPTTDAIAGLGAGCYYWSPGESFFGGTRDQSRTVRRLPAGTYTVQVSAKDMFAFMATVISFRLTAHVTPSAMAACDTAAALVEGVATPGDTTGGPDAFGAACNDTPTASPEALSRFTLAEPRRVRLTVAPRPATGATVAPRARLAVYPACDPGSTRAACAESQRSDCTSTGTLEAVLPAGTYYVVTESADGGAMQYDLTLRTEAVGDACAGAPAITASGSYMGTTAGAPDEFRWNNVCGGGAGPDVVYALTVGASSRVVLDLIASYTSPSLVVESACGGSVFAGSATATHVDRTFAPGTYYVIVGGQGASSAGAYTLNATILPM